MKLILIFTQLYIYIFKLNNHIYIYICIYIYIYIYLDDYSQMYAGMLPIMPVPGTLDATAPVASDMGVVQSSVPGLNTNPSVTNPPQVVDPAYQVPPPPINMQVMPPIAGITALPPTCDQSIGTNGKL